jgi:hypothetical protein
MAVFDASRGTGPYGIATTPGKTYQEKVIIRIQTRRALINPFNIIFFSHHIKVK